MNPSSTAPTAVILAAGMGERLRAIHAEKPKGFVEVGGEPIIARSLRLLEEAGVENIVLVAGWRENVYRDFLRENFPQVRVATNAEYATTGSHASLVIGLRLGQGLPALPGLQREVAAGWRDTAGRRQGREVKPHLRKGERSSGIIILESDLVFEARALQAALADTKQSTLVASGVSGSGDEVWVYAADGQLAHLSKKDWAGAPRLGELVGITHLTAEAASALCDVADTLPRWAHYEDGLNAICGRVPIHVTKIDDLAWGEIDDGSHLARVRDSVWPKILAFERQEKGVTS